MFRRRVQPYASFFTHVRGRLSPSGLAVLRSIGRIYGPSSTSRWMPKYIFPGGYIPPHSQVVPHVENSGFWITDLEIVKIHYANTLALWRKRFGTLSASAPVCRVAPPGSSPPLSLVARRLSATPIASPTMPPQPVMSGCVPHSVVFGGRVVSRLRRKHPPLPTY